MKKYKVIRDNWFKRYWSKDQIAEFNDDEVVPNHFELIQGPVVEVPKVVSEEPKAFSQVIEQAPKQTTGMAAGLEDATPVDAVKSIRRIGRPRKEK